MKCAICSSSDLACCFDLYDDRYGYPGYFELYSCVNCGHKQLGFDCTSETLRDLYTNYYPRSSYKLDDYKPYVKPSGFKAWFNGTDCNPINYVPENVRVLDLGCGFGESLGYFKSRGCDAYGVEADENICRVAERFRYKVHVGLFDSHIYQPDFFDYVTMAQVIEHVTDPVATLKGVARILKPGGVVVLSTPSSNGWGVKVFGRKWINWHVPYHVHHFSFKSIKTVASKAGLVVERYRTITSSEWLYYQWIHLATYPKMGEPSGFWSTKGELNIRQKILVRLLFKIHQTKINHLVGRLFDILNLGDNMVLILRKPLR